MEIKFIELNAFQSSHSLRVDKYNTNFIHGPLYTEASFSHFFLIFFTKY